MQSIATVTMECSVLGWMLQVPKGPQLKIQRACREAGLGLPETCTPAAAAAAAKPAAAVTANNDGDDDEDEKDVCMICLDADVEVRRLSTSPER